MTAPIDTLRAMYRSVRDGAELNAPSLVDAMLAFAADGGEIWRIKGEFQKLGWSVSLDALRGSDGAGTRVREAKTRGGWRGAIRVASAMGMEEVWGAAMTAYYGPSGTHESRLDPDGVPTAATLAEFPRLAEAMRDAAEKFERYCDLRNERNARKNYEDQVVSYSALWDTRKRAA